ncbi:hypothetical protein [Inquilinus limosus]|uniref:hypothetical protein n=1 Tax=Inquilinus limosus TaxID=171674 RepID=UPI000403298B
MAYADKKSLPKFNSCRLTAVWPKLDKPDYGTKQFPDADGKFKTRGRGRLDDPNIQAMIKKLEPLHAQAVEAAEEAFKQLKVETRKKLGKITVNPLYSTIYDPETEEPTGEIEFSFSRRASGEFKKGPRAGQRWNHKLAVFDARGKLMVKVPEIWSGSIIKVQFTAEPYFIPGTGACGLRLGLEAAQLIELVQGGERSAKSFGFGEEDGYTHDDSAVEDEAPEEGFGDETGATDDASSGDF